MVVTLRRSLQATGKTLGLFAVNMIQVALFSHGAEVGHADFASGLGAQKAANQAAQWINDILRKYRP
jgi:hypothetical protein